MKYTTRPEETGKQPDPAYTPPASVATYKYKVGDKVFCLDNNGSIDTGKVQKIDKIFNVVVYTVKFRCGIADYEETNVFTSYENAFKTHIKRLKQKQDEYEGNINNLIELLKFMVSHMYSGEYTDFAAVQAAKNKIDELLGIVVEEV